jgi:REP element-mobilizing transposase RayT
MCAKLTHVRQPLQLSLPLEAAPSPAFPRSRRRRGRGGRKPKGERAGVPHLRRPAHDRRHPVHVTVRVRSGLPTLRSQSIFGCVLAQIRAASRRFLRIAHFSVQSNHIHLLVEANDRGRLTQGMKGFAVRVARRLNQLLGCRGGVWADRYHAHYLSTPREVRNALVYVLCNRAKHGGKVGRDLCSSGPYFDGWSGALRPPARASPEDWPIAPSATWLLNAGWKAARCSACVGAASGGLRDRSARLPDVLECRFCRAQK